MGTRNITIVKAESKPRVVQYGQWDGYPTGQGQVIADFLKTADLKKFKQQVLALKRYTKASMEKAYKDAGHDGGEWVKGEVATTLKQMHPALDRDHGAGILQLIHDGVVVKVRFCTDYNLATGKVDPETWCEYWYEIDLDNETVAMNGGKPVSFNTWKRSGYMEKIEARQYEQ